MFIAVPGMITLAYKIYCDYLASTFIQYCETGNLIEAQKLHKTGKIDTYGYNVAFEMCCRNGHIHVATWLRTVYYYDIANYNRVFEVCCGSGQIKMVKWIYDIAKLVYGLDIGTNNYSIFLTCCINGRLEVAKWLYELGGIDIHVYNDYAFRDSCIFGQIEIAKWLYEIGDVNIRVMNDDAFKKSCRNNRIEVAKWLCTLCEDYNLHIGDGKITKHWISNTIEDLIANKQYDELINKYNYKIISDTETCMICYGNNDKKLEIKCGHAFCIECICEWKFIGKHDECPYCKQKIEFVNN